MQFYEAKSIYDLDDQFFEYFKVDNGYQEYIKDKSFDEILAHAKGKGSSKDEEYAKFYLIINSRKRLYNIFWKNFIGVNASNNVRKARLLNGAFHDFCGIIYIELEKALKSFGRGIDKKVDLKGWQYWFGQYVMGGSIGFNKENMADPIESAINPDAFDGASESESHSYWDKILSDEDKASELGYSDFRDNWRELVKDPAIQKIVKNDVTVAEVIAAYFSGDSISDMAKELDIAKNTLRYNVLPTFGNLCQKYDIDQNELGNILHDDPDFLIKTLRAA